MKVEKNLSGTEDGSINVSRVKKLNPPKTDLPGLILSSKDFEVLSFIRNMKFGYPPILKDFFYDKRLNGTQRDSDFYIRNRLMKFKRAGLLYSVYRPNSREYVYLLTAKGERRLCQNSNEYSPGAREQKFDNRVFDHDYKVQLARLALEKLGRAKNWVAERQVKQKVAIFQGLARKYMPDGLYENNLGELVAFEMEISAKSVWRYQEKIDKYVVLLRSHFDTPVRFARVVFVCEHEAVYKRLAEMTRIHGEKFRVEHSGDLFHKLKRFQNSQEVST